MKINYVVFMVLTCCLFVECTELEDDNLNVEEKLSLLKQKYSITYRSVDILPDDCFIVSPEELDEIFMLLERKSISSQVSLSRVHPVFEGVPGASAVEGQAVTGELGSFWQIMGDIQINSILTIDYYCIIEWDDIDITDLWPELEKVTVSANNFAAPFTILSKNAAKRKHPEIDLFSVDYYFVVELCMGVSGEQPFLIEWKFTIAGQGAVPGGHLPLYHTCYLSTINYSED